MELVKCQINSSKWSKRWWSNKLKGDRLDGHTDGQRS